MFFSFEGFQLFILSLNQLVMRKLKSFDVCVSQHERVIKIITLYIQQVPRYLFAVRQCHVCIMHAHQAI